MQVPVMNMAGEKVGEVELSDAIFAAPINKPLMHQALVRQLANARLGTHKVKGRSEVAGGGRKPWKQKGTGRARQGSTRAAQWRGGGIIFGPTPRSYEQQMPRKMRRAAVRSALSDKAAAERIVVLDSLALARAEDPRDGAGRCATWRRTASVLILMPGDDRMVERSANNLPDVKLLRASYLNVRDLLNYDYVVIPQAALTVIEQILGLTRRRSSRMHVYDVLKRPVVTEKTTAQGDAEPVHLRGRPAGEQDAGQGCGGDGLQRVSGGRPHHQHPGEDGPLRPHDGRQEAGVEEGRGDAGAGQHDPVLRGCVSRTA